jgi:hypothetical protein
VDRHGWGVLVPFVTLRTEDAFHKYTKHKNNTVPWCVLGGGATSVSCIASQARPCSLAWTFLACTAESAIPDTWRCAEHQVQPACGMLRTRFPPTIYLSIFGGALRASAPLTHAWQRA